MNIKLDSRYSISSDSKQYILMLDDRPDNFFLQLEDLIQEYLNLKIRGCEARKLEYLKNYIESVKKQLCKVLQRYNISDIKGDDPQNPSQKPPLKAKFGTFREYKSDSQYRTTHNTLKRRKWRKK